LSNEKEQSLWEAPQIEIAGEEYQLRRLGTRDLTKLWSVIGKVAGHLDLSILEGDMENREALGRSVIEQVLNVGPDAYDDVVKWLVDIVEGLDEEDIEDPSKFPIHAPFTILEALDEHEDFEKFFTKGQKAMQVMKKMGPGSDNS